MSFDFDEEEFERDVKIKVGGVGGGGGNAVASMVKKGIDDVDFIIINTDVAALKSKDGSMMERIQIGKKTTKGRGAGGRPPVAADSAIENRDDIAQALKGASMVFISAGMGGGTGTGASPIIAEIAQEMGILTVGVVTKPFKFERDHKMNLALQGIAELRKHVDALIIIPNERLISVKEKNISMKAAYAMVDEVLYQAVKGISDLVNRDGFVNIDFEDVKSTLENAGDAHMAIGHGQGDDKAEQAVREVVESPLLETSIKNAGKLLVNLIISEDTTLDDVDKVMNLLTDAAAPDVQVIHGVAFDENLSDEIEITVIATCFQNMPENDFFAPKEETATEEVVGGISTSSVESGQTTIQSLQFPATPDTPSDDDDPFKVLTDLFNSRGK